MSGPLRVLHAYSGNLYGGVEVVLATLARSRHLAPGLEPRFALCHDGRIAEELRGLGAGVDLVGPARFSRPWTVWKAQRGFRRALARWEPDAVICHSSWPHALFAAEARRAGAALAFWQHDLFHRAGWVDRRAARVRPDLAIVNSRVTAGTTGRVFPGVPLEVIYCPVAPPPPPSDPRAARLDVRRELDTPEDALAIATTCRLESYKGHSLLIDALGRLRDRPGWVSWIAGGAQRPHEIEYLNMLKRSVDGLGIADRVRFLGQRGDVPRILAAADVHCQPNLGPEPFGIAFVEALHAGLPVVTTAIGGALEIVTDSCGVLVPPADPSALADALSSLIADPSRRASLSSAGPARARFLCDPSATLGRLEEVLRRIVSS
jgi:glycosyltransferase involved in cell wall biosynthesis